MTTVFKLALGLWLAILLNRYFKDKEIGGYRVPFLWAAVLAAAAAALMWVLPPYEDSLDLSLHRRS